MNERIALIMSGISPCCKAPLDDSKLFNGHGWRLCSKCMKMIIHQIPVRDHSKQFQDSELIVTDRKMDFGTESSIIEEDIKLEPEDIKLKSNT